LALDAPWRQGEHHRDAVHGWLTARGDEIVPFIQGHAWNHWKNRAEIRRRRPLSMGQFTEDVA